MRYGDGHVAVFIFTSMLTVLQAGVLFLVLLAGTLLLE